MGNKNVVLGLIAIILVLTMSVPIERTASRHGFPGKAAANDPRRTFQELADL